MNYNLDNCLACNICNINCPVMQVHPQFKGPKLSGPAYERFRMSEDEIDSNILFCSNCKTCDTVCPANVPISTLNMIAKKKYYDKNNHTLADWILSNGEKLGKLAKVLPNFSNQILNIGKEFLDKINIESQAPFPKYKSDTFYDLFNKTQQNKYKNKVVFYPGCFVNFYQPEIGIDLIELLQKFNYEVMVDKRFICCGSPYVSNGYLDKCHANALHNLKLLKYWIVENNIPVITLCTTCSLMLKQEYQELFNLNELSKLANSIYDAGEFISNLLSQTKINLNPNKVIDYDILYHAPCHLKVQGIGLPFYDILKNVYRINIENANSGCCGISGNYGFHKKNYDISLKVGQKLFEKIKNTKTKLVLSECGTCRIQIEHGTNVKTLHPISVLNSLTK